MSTIEEEVKRLKGKNNELVKSVQYWKMVAAERESEKIEIMKDLNDLRLKLSKLRSNNAALTHKLEEALQSSSQEALQHLVQASTAVAMTMDIVKSFVRDKQDLITSAVRWSKQSTPAVTPSSDKILKVRPMMMGGKFIQPVVSLSRTPNSSDTVRSPNQNRRNALPIQMLQDLVIPLTRIDISNPAISNMYNEDDPVEADLSTEDLGLEDSMEQTPEEHHSASNEDSFNAPLRLHTVEEIDEESNEAPSLSQRSRVADPLEGPSWLLDQPARTSSETNKSSSTLRASLEPDSTTRLEESTEQTQRDSHRNENSTSPNSRDSENVAPENIFRGFNALKDSTVGLDGNGNNLQEAAPRTPRESNGSGGSPAEMEEHTYTPTVRRRKLNVAAPTVLTSPLLSHSVNRILKVLVPKMRLESQGEPSAVSNASPAKRVASFDAPSPKGATVPLIVLEAPVNPLSSDSRVTVAGISGGKNNFTGHITTRKRFKRSGSEAESGGSQSRQDRVKSERKEGRSSGRKRRVSHTASEESSRDSDSSSSDVVAGRARRTRKKVTYTEPPLNVKLRR